jgi:hypothetical protein
VVAETENLPAPGGFKRFANRSRVHRSLESRPIPILGFDHRLALPVARLAERPPVNARTDGLQFSPLEIAKAGCFKIAMDVFTTTAELIAAPLPSEAGAIKAEAGRIVVMLTELDRLQADMLASITDAGQRRDDLLLADADLATIDAAAAEIDTLAVTLERIAVAQTLLGERQSALAALMSRETELA